MVFADVEATAIADDLAARARAGDFEPDFEAGAPGTARPSAQEQELEVDVHTEFEISLDPEEEISDVFTEDITAVPDESSLSLEKVQEAPSPPLLAEEAAPEEEKLEVDDLDLELEPVEIVPAESPAVEQPTPVPTAIVLPAEPEIQKSDDDGELVQEPVPVPEPVAEVSEAVPPSTTTEMVPSLPECQLDIDGPTLSTMEIPPSHVEESSPAPAPVVGEVSISLDAVEPIVGDTALTIMDKADVAPTLAESDIAPVPVVSTTETPSVNEETPKAVDVKEETSSAPQPS